MIQLLTVKGSLRSAHQAGITLQGSQVLTALSQEWLRAALNSCHVTHVQYCVRELKRVDIDFNIGKVVVVVHVDVGCSASDLLESFFYVDAVPSYTELLLYLVFVSDFCGRFLLQQQTS